MSDQLQAVALASGVRPCALRRALEAADVRQVADLLGVERAKLEALLLELARAGVCPTRAAAVAVLGA